MALSQVLVTVGTTNFDDLIRKIQLPEILQVLKSQGCQKLVIQYGNGKISPCINEPGIVIECYDYKSSISEDIESSQLVISHAGAGTSLEVLERGKLLITVVNEMLMDNHQLELAQKLESEGYSLYCVPDNLEETLSSLNFDKIKQLKKFPASSAHKFNSFLEDIFGYNHKIK